MANEICYWDEVDQCQKVRDATAGELAEIQARKNAPKPVPVKPEIEVLKEALIAKGYITQKDLDNLK